MQNIHIKRYADQSHGYAGTVEPEDQSWVLFIDKAGKATLWHRVEVKAEDGQTSHAYAPAEN